MIDYRSDNVTKPTEEMRQAMSCAVVGDDVYQEDSTIQQLEDRIKTMFQKEAALFFPSGTMSNLTALLAWCPERDSEIIVGDNSHIFLYEQTAASQYGGISYHQVQQEYNGSMPHWKNAIRPNNDVHEPKTRLLCVENTHNGRILPLFFLQEAKQIASNHGIAVHMDGARIWNALEASHIQPKTIASYVDSLSVCLSKGLGAPIGSLLVGPTDFIEKARRIRKSLGGGMRQSGILAAAGLVALDDFERGILAEDHKKTQRLYQGVLQMNMPKKSLFFPSLRDRQPWSLQSSSLSPPIQVVKPVETNMLFFLSKIPHILLIFAKHIQYWFPYGHLL